MFYFNESVSYFTILYTTVYVYYVFKILSFPAPQKSQIQLNKMYGINSLISSLCISPGIKGQNAIICSCPEPQLLLGSTLSFWIHKKLQHGQLRLDGN